MEEGVCGGKTCCIKVMYQGSPYILKEMKESMNFGSDYLIADGSKEVFGLRDMKMKRIVSDVGLLKKDPKNRSFVKNWVLGDRNAVYCMMEFWENIGDLGKNKGYLKDRSVLKECLKIRLFDGLFRSSDNILRNILVNEEGELLSIDEGDLYGKRARIFNKNEWCKAKNIEKEILDEVVTELLEGGDEKKKKVGEMMVKYGLDFRKEFGKRFDEYQTIVDSEWG